MNPFKEVSTYPPSTPMVGQEGVKGQLEHFLKKLSESTDSAFMAIFGDWGMGKTRVANEIISETTGKSKGWLCFNSESYVRKDLTSGAILKNLLPLMIKFDDIIKSRPTVYDIFWWCLHRALLQLIGGDDTRDRDIQLFVNQIAPSCIKALNKILTQTVLRDDAIDQCKRSIAKIVESNSIDRLLVIVDEVESIGEQSEIPVEGAKGQERDLIRILFNGIKDQVNINPDSGPKIEKVGFLLLCSEGVSDIERETRSPALERRYFRTTLGLPTRSDILKLVESITKEHKDISRLNQEVFESAFFAADRNLGWFMFISAALWREHELSGEIDRIVLMREVARKVGQVFLEDGIDSIENDISIHDEDKRWIVPVVLSLVPTQIDNLGLNATQALSLTEVEDSYGSKVLGLLKPLDGFPSVLVRQLVESAEYEEGDPIQDMRTLIGTHGYPLKPVELARTLSIFVDTEGRHMFFINKDNLYAQLRYYYDPSIPEVVMNDIHSALNALTPANGTLYLGPTVEFLTRFLKHVRSRSVRRRWLESTTAWAENTKKLNEVLESTKMIRQRVCTGLGIMLYPSNETQIDERHRSPNVVVKLHNNDLFSISGTSELLILFHSTKRETIDDLNKFSKRSKGDISDVVAILIVDDETKRNEAIEAISSANLDSSEAIVVGAVPKGSLEQEFLIRYSFVKENESSTISLSAQGKRIRQGFMDSWTNLIGMKLIEMIESGTLLQPLYFPSRGYKLEDITDAYYYLLNGWKYPDDFDEETPKSRRITSKKKVNMKKAIVDNEEKSSGPTLTTSRLFTDEHTPLIPKQLLKLLSYFRTQPYTMNNLATRFFIRRTYDIPIQQVLKDMLNFLERLGLVHKDANAKYRACDGQYVSSQIKKATLKIRVLAMPTDTEDYSVTSLASYFQGALLGDLKISESDIAKTQSGLDAASDKAAGIDLTDLISKGSLSELKKIVRNLRKTHGLAEQVTRDVADSNNLGLDDLIEKIDEVSNDTKYQTYGIVERIALLKKLKIAIEQDISDLEDRIGEVEVELASISAKFCSKPMEHILDSIKCQIQWDEVIPVEEIRIDEEDNKTYSLKKLMKSGKIKDVSNRISHYYSLLHEEENDLEQLIGEVTDE